MKSTTSFSAKESEKSELRSQLSLVTVALYGLLFVGWLALQLHV